MEAWETRALLASNRLMFKYKHETDYLVDFSRDTRQSKGTVFHVDKPNSSMYRNSVSYLSRKCWNDLPVELRSTADYECFKYLIKRHYKTEKQ